MHHRSRLRQRAGPLAGLLVALAGCSGDPPDPQEPVPAAGSVACAQLLARLPARVLDQQRTSSDDPGSAGWGHPAIRLRCGLAPSGPTSTPCQSVDGVDWLFTDAGEAVRFVSYGRDPGVELIVPLAYRRENAAAALVDLASAVRPIPVTRRCT